MAGVSNGPLPSSLVLLSDLQKSSPGQKVRFLGCVTTYSTENAILTLQHDYPAGNNLQALVEVELVLSTLKSDHTRSGEWVNVIGYVKSPKQVCRLHASASSVTIQAIVLWPSGPIKLDGYETILDHQRSSIL